MLEEFRKISLIRIRITNREQKNVRSVFLCSLSELIILECLVKSRDQVSPVGLRAHNPVEMLGHIYLWALRAKDSSLHKSTPLQYGYWFIREGMKNWSGRFRTFPAGRSFVGKKESLRWVRIKASNQVSRTDIFLCLQSTNGVVPSLSGSPCP